ncbi:MAG: LysR family transcriptional regulator [Caldilineaceae bacterium]|nr:LysR family transcriptional regulator [Caldilineaceae bacterium]
MEIVQLRALVGIVRAGSFTAAAETLYVTQSALSQQIKALETELGLQLFERQGRRITLTAPGKVVLARAEQILTQLHILQQELTALQQGAQGRLRIGTSDTVCLYLLPPVVRAFREQYPQVEIHLTNRPSREVATLLVEGELDFGIISLPVSEPQLESEYLCARTEVAICAPTHPLAAQTKLTLESLLAYPLLLLEKGTTSRALLDQLLAQAGYTAQMTELGSIEVLKRYAEIGLGVAIVPAMAVTEDEREARLHTLSLPWLPVRAVGMVRRRTSYVTPAEQAFLELLQRLVASSETV